MAKIFLDANIVIDLFERRRAEISLALKGQDVFISPLSIHILAYTYKYHIPSEKLSTDLKTYFNFVSFSEHIMQLAFQGPTKDFEDNVQLQSAAEAGCDLFLTHDKRLKGLRFFGKVKIDSEIM